jgi:uncharacterized protein YPO0396
MSRVLLINWHFIEKKIININNGSVLFSGETGTGKSTAMDAIQYVLSTNHDYFNTAANENSKRDLKGYVRCRLEKKSSYKRSGRVISYIALEFYEDVTQKHFVVGVKIESPDPDSRLEIKWYIEECKLDDITFETDGRPSTSDQFYANRKKVQLIESAKEARNRMKRRYGNIDHRFFHMVPRLVAYRPIDEIKDFMTSFLLPEKNVDMETLKNNIASLKEFEELVAATKKKLDKLDVIIHAADQIATEDENINTYELLLQKTRVEQLREKVGMAIEKIEFDKESVEHLSKNIETLTKEADAESEKLAELRTLYKGDPTVALTETLEENIRRNENDLRDISGKVAEYNGLIDGLGIFLSDLEKSGHVIVNQGDIAIIKEDKEDHEVKSQIVRQIKHGLDEISTNYSERIADLQPNLKKAYAIQEQLSKELTLLNKNEFTFPPNTVRLRDKIDQEFRKRKIDSEVRVFSDLLEITDSVWQPAIESYLGGIRFNLIVEPDYYEIALNTYNRHRDEISGVGLVNTKKLPHNVAVDESSLAYIVNSDNRFAKDYANLLLNSVSRCDDYLNLKEYKTAMTATGFLYKNFTVRKLQEQSPFIGALAIELQKKDKTEKLAQRKRDIAELGGEIEHKNKAIKTIPKLKIHVIEDYMDFPNRFSTLEKMIREDKKSLEDALKNPNMLEFAAQKEKLATSIEGKRKEAASRSEKKGKLEGEIDQIKQLILSDSKQLAFMENEFKEFCQSHEAILTRGLEKYESEANVKAKSKDVIIANFERRKSTVENQKKTLVDKLEDAQFYYCKDFGSDYGRGYENIKEYRNEHYKLKSSELIKYEEDLRKARENCENEFRDSFLAKLKENIEQTKMDFRELNKIMNKFYYGEDSYEFMVTANPTKKVMYDMIMSKNNEEGFTIFSSMFEAEYKEEINEMFDKLTALDNTGDKVLEEYTDYRNYLDYDIQVHKKDGRSEMMSESYDCKSGGESQSPFYVAIAASFAQLYKNDDTIRILMFDEAFDKMDDLRTSSMMDFFNSHNFQLLIAAPPHKIQAIGEKVNTILVAVRNGVNTDFMEYTYA